MNAPSSPYRGRFAPSPTGALHFGSLVAALGSWLRARHAGGTWIVRIEDLDPPREIAGAANGQLAALSAFGLASDEPVIWQHDRHDAYAAALQQLVAERRAFACWCSRTDLQRSGGLHRSPCVAAPDATRAPAWRLRVDDETIGFDDVVLGRYEQRIAEAVGDFVIRRVEGHFAYQLAVVVDDAAQGITEVVRGADLLDSTPRQILLQRCLALPTPAYLHLPLALDADGRKLSKQDQALPIRPDDPLPALRRALTFLGIAPQQLQGLHTVDALLRQAVAAFDVAAIPRVGSIVHMRHGLS
ncbi:MAG TPA: tRNA glutamyl-Q(34) synthetase GluQRS [Tahibacter sp.]|uniref:tRNA glutamyl-Q(34) synthetase GluQRS n=1 Tax=Tahibacter sp. TaxID=2056211 RepID=UPI002C855081|nr:tRNA glutamyl-Q(34) synthetase GluQRS [Tahibacter sp.]HSX62820.1 tRNA glutamyl-Q(34) synthetase GluQRS [Tahibacter sp.]